MEMAAISGAHALLTNIVLAWNTNRMGTVVTKLNQDGVGIEEDWLRRIGPAHFSHINFRGTMRFGVEKFAAALIQRAMAGTGTEQSELTQTATIAPYVDFSSLDVVSVVTDGGAAARTDVAGADR